MSLVPGAVRACLAFGVDCEDASVGTYDGGSVDYEYYQIFPSERRVTGGGSHSYLVTASFSPGCGVEYSGKFTVIRDSLPTGWTVSLNFPNGNSAWGVGMGWAGTGSCTVNLTVTAPSGAAVGDKATLRVRVWCNDTYRCNEHDTVDTVTNTVVSAYPDISIEVANPRSGEWWPCGSQRGINWTATGGKGSLTIGLEYSTKGGATWVPIASGLPNTGTYLWTVPTVPLSYNCFVRVTATDSDSPPFSRNMTGGKFYIKPTGAVPPMVTLLMPTGGQVWQQGWNSTINWEAVGGKGTLKIWLDYSTTGSGGPWMMVAANVYNTGKFTWHVPDDVSADCYIRVTVKDGSNPPATAEDLNDKPFVITDGSIPESGQIAALSVAAGMFLLAITVAVIRKMDHRNRKLCRHRKL